MDHMGWDDCTDNAGWDYCVDNINWDYCVDYHVDNTKQEYCLYSVCLLLFTMTCIRD